MSANNFSGLKKEPIPVKKPSSALPMNLPRADDAKVHQAVGSRDNASAAWYADAVGQVICGPAGAPMPQADGT